MHQVKVFSILILLLIVLVIVLQNTEPVVTKLLFISITMPRAVLLFGTTVLGFVLGVLVSFMMIRRNKASTKQ